MQRHTPMPRGAFDAAEATREQFEIIDQLWDSVERRNRVVAGIVAVTLLAVGGTAWYTLRAISRQQVALSRVSAESSQPASPPTSPPVANTEVASLQAKVTQMEESQRQSEARIVELQQQLGEIRATPSQTSTYSPQNSKRDATPMDRIPFEVVKGHSKQLTTGISIGVTRVDSSQMAVDGWMWIMPDRRTVWVHGRGAQQQVVFYPHQDGKRHELVISQIGRDSIGGYLLVPK